MLTKVLLGSSLLATSLFIDTKPKCCGIVGIVSKTNSFSLKPKNQENQSSITVEGYLTIGIQLLKNRGYDSAGMVTLVKKNELSGVNMLKLADEDPNQLSCIERLVTEVTNKWVDGLIGIGHTRWATCGQKVARNAHPHSDDANEIYLVHNGIINNHMSVKDEYLQDIGFRSQTDTQVIVQLIGLLRKKGKTMLQSLQELPKVFNEGSQWGLVIIQKSNPHTIYTATNKSPILVGFSKSEQQIFIASEMIAFYSAADCYFQTKTGEILQLSVDKIPEIKQKLRKENRLNQLKSNVKYITSPKPYDSFYEYEIREQGLLPFSPNIERVKILKFGEFLTMIACGSSYYAAMCSHHVLKMLKCFKKVSIIDPVQILQDDVVEDETVVLISQSGQTADLINILNDCKLRQGVKTVGIINVQGSTLARKVDFPVYIKVGREVSVAATKSFFHQVLNLIQFATEVAERKEFPNFKLITTIRENLIKTPQFAKQTILIAEKQCKEIAQIIAKKESIYLLAKNQGLAVAKEAALKIKQLNYIHAQALGACQMKHGPIALIQSDKKQQTIVIVFVFNNHTFNQLMNTLDQMHSRNAYVVMVSDCQEKVDQHFQKSSKNGEKVTLKKYNYVINVPYLQHLSHLLAVIPMQILVSQIAKIKKIKPDMPRNLAKTVTVP